MSIVSIKSIQRGFTIVELLISMAILSVLLVVVSAAMVSIGNLYYKGINQAKVQNSARSLSDQLSSHLQLTGGNSGVGPFPVAIETIQGRPYDIKVYCIGDVRYTYVLGIQQGSNSTADNPQIPHVLWRDKQSGSCTDSLPNLKASNPGTEGADLVPSGARLTEFEILPGGVVAGAPETVSPSQGVYGVKIGIAYGENDLLTNTVGPDVRCKGGENTKFCASAYLNTKVTRRL